MREIIPYFHELTIWLPIKLNIIGDKLCNQSWFFFKKKKKTHWKVWLNFIIFGIFQQNLC